MAFNNSFYNERLPTNLKRLNFGIYRHRQTLNWVLPVQTDAQLGFTGRDRRATGFYRYRHAQLGFTGTDRRSTGFYRYGQMLNWDLPVRTDAQLGFTGTERRSTGIYRYGQTLNWDLPVRTDAQLGFTGMYRR